MDSIWTQLADTVRPIGSAMGPYAPRLLGALAIVAAAWLAARLVRAALTRAAAAGRLDERANSPGLGATLAGVAGALVWLLALPALLGTLELQGLLTPVNAMLSRLMGFVPNLLGAAVVLGIGLLVAGIVKQIVVGLLKAAGSEKAAQRLGLGTSLGADGLAGMAGNVVYVLILLPTLVAALQPLGLDALTNPLSRLLETITTLIPRLFSAAILVGVAVLIGRAVANLVSALLSGVGLDKLPEKVGAAPFQLGGRSLSELTGTLVMVGIVTVAAAQATEILGLPVLTEIVSIVGDAAARLVVALVLGLAGLMAASAAARTLQASGARNAGLLAHGARGAILFFTAALVLRQAGLPAEIVTIAFAAIVGALAVGVGVAIGVGGRHAAGRVVDGVVASFEAENPAAAAPATNTAPAASAAATAATAPATPATPAVAAAPAAIQPEQR